MKKYLFVNHELRKQKLISYTYVYYNFSGMHYKAEHFFFHLMKQKDYVIAMNYYMFFLIESRSIFLAGGSSSARQLQFISQEIYRLLLSIPLIA